MKRFICLFLLTVFLSSCMGQSDTTNDDQCLYL